jgi:hypothetical protein
MLWLVLVLAIADVCHRTQYYEQVVEGSERNKCFLPESYRNLLPFRPSSPLVLHLATKITCLYSTSIDLQERNATPPRHKYYLPQKHRAAVWFAAHTIYYRYPDRIFDSVDFLRRSIWKTYNRRGGRSLFGNYRISPNIRRDFFFKYCFLEKGGRLIFEASRINFKKTVPPVKRGSFLLK